MKCECCGQEIPRQKSRVEQMADLIYLNVWDDTGSMYEGVKASLDYYFKHKDDIE